MDLPNPEEVDFSAERPRNPDTGQFLTNEQIEAIKEKEKSTENDPETKIAETETQIQVLWYAEDTDDLNEIKDRVDKSTITNREISKIINTFDLPAEYREGEYADPPPMTSREKVTTILDDNPDLHRKAMKSSHGYLGEIHDAITDRWGEGFTVSEKYISQIARKYVDELDEEEAMDLETLEPVNTSPSTVRGRIEVLFSEKPDLARRAYRGKNGIRDEINDLLEARWGKDARSAPNYISKQVSEWRDELDEHAFETSSEDDHDDATGGEPDTSLLDAPLDPIDDGTQFSSSIDRVRHVIRSDETIMRDVIEHFEGDNDRDELRDLLGRIKHATKDRFGVTYIPTKGAVHKAIIELRNDGLLGGNDEHEFPSGEGAKNIVYTCELCGYENPNYKAIRAHIAREDDAIHADRTGKEVHLIGKRGEDISSPHELYEDATFQSRFDDGFEVIWAIHQNPDAPQDHIAEMLGMSKTTLSSRLDDLGIEWTRRESQINDLLDSWESDDEDDETITATKGNATYSGRATGIDGTMRTIQESRQNNPNIEQRITVDLTTEEARDLLCGDGSAVKEKVFSSLLDLSQR